MKAIEVFDPAQCCSTGVCGPSVDPALARFAADLNWVSDRGAAVERRNLAQQGSSRSPGLPIEGVTASRASGVATVPYSPSTTTGGG